MEAQDGIFLGFDVPFWAVQIRGRRRGGISCRQKPRGTSTC